MVSVSPLTGTPLHKHKTFGHKGQVDLDYRSTSLPPSAMGVALFVWGVAPFMGAGGSNEVGGGGGLALFMAGGLWSILG